MEEKIIEIKEGIKLHLINTNLFKTNLASVFITSPIKRETVTLNTMIPFLLKRGTMNYKTQYEINDKLESLYGSTFDCGIDKSGDNQVLKFYMDGISNEYVPDNENLLKENLDLLFEIVFNPLFENGMFKKEFLDIEKSNLENVINSKIDDKDYYAFNDCLEKVYGKQGYGLYKYGYVEDVENMTIELITNRYKELINNSKIDIFVSGNFDDEFVEKLVKENQSIKNLNDRIPNFIICNHNNCKIEENNLMTEYIEKMNVTQGKLIITLETLYDKKDFKYVGMVFNSIFGDGANSKLFQNVREKAGLAYSTKSAFVRPKRNIFVRCGIEIPNYEKAKLIVKEQLKDVKSGNFTDEDIENAKTYLIAGIKTIETEQDSGIVYYFGQELTASKETILEYIENIKNVSRESIIEFAKKIQTNSTYFLTNK